jgi:quinol monooxygenase YgiN
MAGFAQHTRIRARPGKGDELLAKFVEAADLQHHNPACELTLVSESPDDADVVYLTEVWASAEDHERARNSPEVQAWAKGMPELVDGPPETTRLDPVALR